jgi:hypothetical protein
MIENKRTIAQAKKAKNGTIYIYIKKNVAESMQIKEGDLLEVKKAKEKDIII